MRAHRLGPLFLVLVTCITVVSSKEYTLGLLIPYDVPRSDTSLVEGKYYAPAMIQAVDDVNNRSDLLPGHHLSFIWNETSCNETQALQALTYLIHEKQVSAIIGPACSCRTAARLASALDIPMVSYKCNEPLYDSESYSTFTRTSVQVAIPKLSRGLVMLLQKFNWSQVAVLYENSSYYIGIKDQVVEVFQKENINVRMQKPLITFRCYTMLKFSRTCATANFTNRQEYSEYVRQLIKDIKEDARIVVYITDYRVSRLTLLHAFDEGMTFGDYAFIVVQLDQETFIRNQGIPQQYYLLPDVPLISTCDYYQALESVIVVEIKPTGAQNQSYKYFGERVKTKFNNSVFPRPPLPPNFSVPFIAAYLYDAVFQFAIALTKTFEQNEPPTGRNIIGKMVNSSYDSKSGARVIMDQDGTADFANLGIVDMRWDSSSRANNCDSNPPFDVNMGEIDLSGESPFVDISISAVRWPQGKRAPADSPPCGFDGELCVSTTPKSRTNNNSSDIAALIGGICALAGVIFIILLVIMTRNYMLKREMDSLLWKINYKDISWARSNHLPSIDEEDISATSARKTSTQFTFTNFGFYKENRVTVKQVGTKAIDLTKGILLELKQMRDFRHENCVQFFGATVDAPNICIVSAFHPRTLKDLLTFSDVNLDKTFMSSLVSDIAKGMAYLHSSEIKSHGSLKSSNCLIDSRWTLKISDYGLTSLKMKCNLSSKRTSEDLLWTAPEILRDSLTYPKGTQKGDVYSFAIILQEFHTREGPFSNEKNITTKAIIERVRNVEMPEFRPYVSNFIPELEELRDLMKNCWEEDPDSRPDFTEIKRRIHRTMLTKGMKTNIFDSMIYMMENYTDNLEDLVTERTGQLIEAKRETEELLDKILPRSVAEQLKKGKSVEAENFDEVSIYFSDIVGFTELSSESSPMQVVTLLNDLYTLFDDIISEYRVYKVETIGDAYMVVSGLPLRNGHDHAGEISLMALHLLDAVKQDFVVRHKPNFKLDLRIGIHSGPCVAGVVGNTMPRYCLFGDTVNTASRMESNGEPLKIHISEATKNILDSLGGFFIEERGEVFLKGKGLVRTYWLVDHKQRRGYRVPRSPRKVIRKETFRKSLFSNVTGEDFKNSPITRSSSLRRSLKSASSNPVNKLPVIKMIADTDLEERNQHRKSSTHSITRV